MLLNGMNKHFDNIEGANTLPATDRKDFASYLYVYKLHIGKCFGEFNWNDAEFVHFCKVNKIQKKGNKLKKEQDNHFWFASGKPQGDDCNDIAFHFLRHIRNAFAHGNIISKQQGKRNKKYYLIEDWEKKNDDEVQTMSGVIRSDLLWSMLWLLFQTKK